MNKTSIVWVGIGGYGATYFDYFIEGIIPWEAVTFAGVVDPYAEDSRFYPMIKQKGIPVYPSLTDFYRQNHAQLAVIATPIHLHREQCEEALRNGSHVLCEKPLASSLEDLYKLAEAESASGRRLAVGFQWSFSSVMFSLKQAIMEGRFGKPLLLKTLLSWPRSEAYYSDSTWKGRVFDKISGCFVNDSVLMNATAHYLHNISFLLGGAVAESAVPVAIQAELYRTKDIETFDSCFIKGSFESGARFFYAASHACEKEMPPLFTYTFEHAEIGFNDKVSDGQVHVRYADGRDLLYGDPFTQRENARKLITMLEFIQTGAEIPCGIKTVYPHLAVCDVLHKKAGIHPLACPQVLDDNFTHLYESAAMPSEMRRNDISHYDWACEAVHISMPAWGETNR